MGKIYKISAQSSFLDNLSLGLINNPLYNKDLNKTLIILPTNLSCKLLYESLVKNAANQLILPKIIPLADLSNSDDPYKYLADFLNTPTAISALEIKLHIWKIYDQWQNTHLYNKLQFCNDIFRCFIELEELETNFDQFLDQINIQEFEGYDKVIINFLVFFLQKWLIYLKTTNKISFIVQRNLLVRLRAENLNKLNIYKHIILAGTTGVNKCTKYLINKIIKHPQGVFIFHETNNIGHSKTEFYPDYSNITNHKLSQINLWHLEKKPININNKLIITNDIEQQARLIYKIIKHNKDHNIHTNVIINNLELRNLILYQLTDLKAEKQNYYNNNPIQLILNIALEIIKYIETSFHKNKYENLLEDKLKLDKKYKIINLLQSYYYLNDKHIEIKEFINNISSIELESLKNYDISNIFAFIKKISHQFNLDNELTKITNLLINKDINSQIETLNYIISKPNNNIYYNNSFVTFLNSKEARFKYNNNNIIADISENSWQPNILNIFNNNHLISIIKVNLLELRKKQIANDFLIQKYNPLAVFTKISLYNKKQNLDYFYSKYIKIRHHCYYDDLKNIPVKVLAQEKTQIFCKKEQKTHNFSVTQIEKLLQNPYSIYASKILNLKSIQLFKFEYEKQFFGIMIHEIIDKYVKNFTQHQDHFKYLQNLYNTKLKSIIWHKSLQYYWHHKFNYIAKWLINQHNESIISKAKILTEYQIKHQINNIYLTAKVDRLEFYDNKLKIIDYKTGIPATQSQIISGTSNQLALEAYIALNLYRNYTENEIKLEYWQLKGKKNEAGKVCQIKESAKITMIAQENIKKIIADYQNSNQAIIAFPNENNLPKYDDYYHLARYENN
jgi:RecB family exonuclease